MERHYNDLSYTIPYHLLRDNTKNISVVHAYTRKKRTRNDCYTKKFKKEKKKKL